MIDMHIHILPGLDDGARSLNQSLEMLRIACREDIDTMIVTPHNMPGKGSPSKETILESIRLLQEEASKAGIFMRLFSGTEYFFRQEVMELLEKEDPICLAETDCVLIEFDPSADRKYIRNALREIQEMGYTPVLAHAERYAELMKDSFETIRELRSLGVLIQINCGSVIGDFGREAKKHTRKLLKEGLVDLLGTDAHNDTHRAPKMKDCICYIEKKCGAEYADRLRYAKALALE